MRALVVCALFAACAAESQPPQRPALRSAGASRPRRSEAQTSLLASAGPAAESSLAHIGRSSPASTTPPGTDLPSFKW